MLLLNVPADQSWASFSSMGYIEFNGGNIWAILGHVKKPTRFSWYPSLPHHIFCLVCLLYHSLNLSYTSRNCRIHSKYQIYLWGKFWYPIYLSANCVLMIGPLWLANTCNRHIKLNTGTKFSIKFIQSHRREVWFSSKKRIIVALLL